MNRDPDMLDTYNNCMISGSNFLHAPLHIMQNVWFHGANAFGIQASDRRRFLVEKVDMARRRVEVRVHAAYHLLRRLAGREKTNSYPHLMIKKMNDRAALRYVPQPYAGRVAIIRPKAYFTGRRSPDLGWSGVVRDGLEIHELAVYPKGMLNEPFCRSLAETLKLCLQNA
jgi:hypothetical protein